MHRENYQEKVRRAVSTVIFDTKREGGKSRTGISDAKGRGVKTLAPVHQNHQSHGEETQRRIENRQISWDIQSKLIYSKWKSWKMLKHSLKIDKKSKTSKFAETFVRNRWSGVQKLKNAETLFKNERAPDGHQEPTSWLTRGPAPVRQAPRPPCQHSSNTLLTSTRTLTEVNLC